MVYAVQINPDESGCDFLSSSFTMNFSDSVVVYGNAINYICINTTPALLYHQIMKTCSVLYNSAQP